MNYVLERLFCVLRGLNKGLSTVHHHKIRPIASTRGCRRRTNSQAHNSEEEQMGSYNLDELIVLWEREKLTTEQTVGQILMTLRSLHQRIRELERRRWRQGRADSANPTRE